MSRAHTHGTLLTVRTNDGDSFSENTVEAWLKAWSSMFYRCLHLNNGSCRVGSVVRCLRLFVPHDQTPTRLLPSLYVTALFCLVLLCCTIKTGGKHYKLRFGPRWDAPKLTKRDLKLNGRVLLLFSLLQLCMKIHKQNTQICKMVQSIYCENMVSQDRPWTLERKDLHLSCTLLIYC
jgi:hypothetical protein